MRILYSWGKSLLFGMIFIITLFGILYYSVPFAFMVFLPAKTDRIGTDMLKAQMEQLFDICSYEYKYNTIITRSKVLGSLGELTIGKESKLLIRAEGIIRAGCKVKDIIREDGNIVVTLSQPAIIESYVTLKKTLDLIDSWYSEFDITEDKDAADRVHVRIETKINDELVKGATERSKSVLSGFLVSSDIPADEIRFKME